MGWLAAVCRLCPTIIFLPPLNWAGLPWGLRTGIAAGIALIAAPVAGAKIASDDVIMLGLAREIGVGAMLAAVACLPFWSLQVAGALSEVAWGFVDEEAAPAAQSLYILGAAIVVGLGGHSWIVAGLVGTYSALPVGGVMPSGTEALARSAAEMLGAAVLIALPLLAVCGLAHVAGALSHRLLAVPSGLPIRPVAVTLGLLALAPLVGAVMSREIAAVLAFLAGG
jgi:flagellar biosynthesis protein FliR